MMQKIRLNILFVLLFVLIITSVINAQLKIGLNGGVNMASYTLTTKSPDATLINKVGFSIGGIIDFPIIERLSVRLLPRYIQRGGKNKILVLSDIHNKIYYDYIELASYLTYKLIDTKISAKIIWGLSFGYLINAIAKSGNYEFDLKDNMNLSNLTSDFGLEIEVPIYEKTSLIVNGTYLLGLKDISKIEGEMKTKDILVCFGFLYKLF